jgi:hypothetical protein
MLDSNTGLPLAVDWKDTNWSDPNIVLTNIEFHEPLGVVADELRDRFKNDFDILPLPKAFNGENLPPTGFNQDWGNLFMDLRLRNVRASEVFNAMNLVFENDRTPLLWELKSPPGGRPLVLLRVLPEAARLGTEPGPSETHRMVYFVGNLVGDPKSGGLTMDQVVKTISDLWPKEFGDPNGVFQFHNDAQLLVVNGTTQQLEFVRQILAALEQRVAAARPKSAETKEAEELVNLIKSLKQTGVDTK